MSLVSTAFTEGFALPSSMRGRGKADVEIISLDGCREIAYLLLPAWIYVGPSSGDPCCRNRNGFRPAAPIMRMTLRRIVGDVCVVEVDSTLRFPSLDEKQG